MHITKLKTSFKGLQDLSQKCSPHYMQLTSVDMQDEDSARPSGSSGSSRSTSVDQQFTGVSIRVSLCDQVKLKMSVCALSFIF